MEKKKQFVIAWKSKVNGRSGKGTKEFDKNAAESICLELNIEYPQVRHWVEEA